MVLGQIQGLVRLLQILWSAASKEKILEKKSRFVKAFDTILHDIFADNLRLYGLNSSAVCLVESYLSQRYQVVYYRNYYFQFLSVKTFWCGGMIAMWENYWCWKEELKRTICNVGQKAENINNVISFYSGMSAVSISIWYQLTVQWCGKLLHPQTNCKKLRIGQFSFGITQSNFLEIS